MINSEQIIYLRIDRKTKIFVSVLVAAVFALFVTLSVYYLVIRPEPSEDFRLAVISLLPAAAIAVFGWIFVLKLKGALSERDLMEQTAWVLSIDLPQTIGRRVYSDAYCSDVNFRPLSASKESDLEDMINLYDPKQAKEISDHIQVLSNVIIGVPSCIYRFQGKAIPKETYAAHLEMHIQVNVKRVEVIYKLPLGAANQDLVCTFFEATQRGSENVGYDVKIVTQDAYCEMQARIMVGSEMLINSRERLFIVNDIAVMTAFLIRELTNKAFSEIQAVDL